MEYTQNCGIKSRSIYLKYGLFIYRAFIFTMLGCICLLSFSNKYHSKFFTCQEIHILGNKIVSEDDILFLVSDNKNKSIFTGDTMFIGRTGRTISPRSSIKNLYKSVYKILLKLPFETMIYPGHHYGYKMFDNIGNNMISSKFFSCKKFEDFCLIMDKYEKNRKNE